MDFKSLSCDKLCNSWGEALLIASAKALFELGKIRFNCLLVERFIIFKVYHNLCIIQKKFKESKKMNEKIEKVLTMWHERFNDEDNQYSEFESSDIEYFVGCLLYNHFNFSKALDTMKTIDLSYDFISSCGDEYDEVQEIISTIKFDTEEESMNFLQKYILDSRLKYAKPELYLLDRLNYHVGAMADRYAKGVDAKPIDFENPLLRK